MKQIYICNKILLLNKEERLNNGDETIQRHVTRQIGSSKFMKFKDSEQINNEVDIDSFENLQEFIDYLAGNSCLQNVEQFVFLGQFTYTSQGKSEFDVIYENQKARNLNNLRMTTNKNNDNNEFNEKENIEKDNINKENQVEEEAKSDESVSRVLSNNKSENSLILPKRNFSSKEKKKY